MLSDTRISLVYCTTSDKAEAESIGRTCVQERVAACANVIDSMRSYYWWKGTVQSEKEAVLICKTTDEMVDTLTRRIRELHSYECPCVVALPVCAGNPDFLQWINDQVPDPPEIQET